MRVWAPKPRITPITPALARSGAMSTPITSRMTMMAVPQTVIAMTLLRSEPMAAARCSVRWVRRMTESSAVLVTLRVCSSRSRRARSEVRRTTRLTIHPRTTRTMNAMTMVAMTLSGVPMSHSQKVVHQATSFELAAAMTPANIVMAVTPAPGPSSERRRRGCQQTPRPTSTSSGRRGRHRPRRG